MKQRPGPSQHRCDVGSLGETPGVRLRARFAYDSAVSTKAGMKRPTHQRRGRTSPEKRSDGMLYSDVDFGKNVAELRMRRGLTQEDVADHLGITKGLLSKKERGQVPLWASEASKLHGFLHGWTGFPYLSETEARVRDGLRDHINSILEFLSLPEEARQLVRIAARKSLEGDSRRPSQG